MHKPAADQQTPTEDYKYTRQLTSWSSLLFEVEGRLVLDADGEQLERSLGSSHSGFNLSSGTGVGCGQGYVSRTQAAGSSLM